MAMNRSAGLSPGVPWAGPLPGGGYQGLTPKLDAAVLAQARWLETHLGEDVEVRFNSDRRSGGAFLAVGEFSHDIGLGVALTTEGGLSYAVYASQCFLVRPELATEGGYAYPRFRTARGAREWVARNVRREEARV